MNIRVIPPVVTGSRGHGQTQTVTFKGLFVGVQGGVWGFFLQGA